MTAAQHTTPFSEASPLWAVRRWRVWHEPVLAIVYMFALVLGALGLGAGYALRTATRPHDVLTFLVLLACAAVCVEGTRRLGQSTGVVRDLLFAWGVPVLMLLPPVYAFVFPLPVAFLIHLRVRRSPLYRRVITTAGESLAGGVASIIFHLTLPAEGIVAPEAWLGGAGAVGSVAVALGSAALCVLLQEVMVISAVHLSSLQVSWREIWDREVVKLDLVEVCVGVLVGIAVLVSPPLAMLAVPPVLLLQRSLVHEQLRAAARTDSKTGLLNAGTWQVEAESEVTRASRTGESAALLLIDIDHFKRVNDEHGHLAGDDVLAGIAELLGGQLRDYDLLGRFGGEEFIVLLPATDAAEAYRVAERLRSQAGITAFPIGDGHRTVTATVSVGVALLPTHADDLMELMAAADLALYHAKASGRDRVCLPAGGGLDGSAKERGAAAGDGGSADGGSSDGGRLPPVVPGPDAEIRLSDLARYPALDHTTLPAEDGRDDSSPGGAEHAPAGWERQSPRPDTRGQESSRVRGTE